MKTFLINLLVLIFLTLLLLIPIKEQLSTNNTYFELLIYHKGTSTLDLFFYLIDAFILYSLLNINILFYIQTHLSNSIVYYQYRCQSNRDFTTKILIDVGILILKNIILLSLILITTLIFTQANISTIKIEDIIIIYLSTMFLPSLVLVLSTLVKINTIIIYFLSTFIFTILIVFELSSIVYMFQILIIFFIYYILKEKNL